MLFLSYVEGESVYIFFNTAILEHIFLFLFVIKLKKSFARMQKIILKIRRLSLKYCSHGIKYLILRNSWNGFGDWLDRWMVSSSSQSQNAEVEIFHMIEYSIKNYSFVTIIFWKSSSRCWPTKKKEKKT